ncbi:MAG: DUF362 domain-containing protein [Promethearchaeota archaeon]
MKENKAEIEILFKQMLKEQQEKAPTDKIYQKDMEDVGIFKVQWKICGILGYQIYEKDKISYKFGETLEEPDVTLVIRNKELASRFLKGEVFDFDILPGYKKEYKIHYTEGKKIVETKEGQRRVPAISKPFVVARFNREKNHHPYILSKLPIFRKLVVETRVNPDDIGYYIPINQSLGTYENQTLPIKIIRNFIEKASNILILNQCGCRKYHGCKDYDVNIGCIYMGDDIKKIKMLEGKHHLATKEEALEHVQRAVDNGLIPLIGRAMDEAVGFGVEDTGHFMSMCFCCPCCCTNVKNTKYGTISINFFRKIEGLKISVDPDLCTGCGTCLESCVFDALKVDEIAIIDEEKCMGCGRCEKACLTDAISLKITDPRDIDELIEKIESHVDVTPSS